MGADAPYLYTPSVKHGSSFDFNPRAYSQATYAASLERTIPKPKREGPLIDLNRHPDSWMVVTPIPTEYKPMAANTRMKVLVCRGLQLFLRILELVGALGLFVCAIFIRGTENVQGWIMRIPPAYDAILNVYAIYHLARPAHKRPAGSSASYNFFAIMMDGGLIPFYVYMSMFSYSNLKLAPGTDGRWRSIFAGDDDTHKVLQTAFLTSTVLGGMHVLSMALDFILLILFRKISDLPPDMNPLDVAPKTSKHKYKNSEVSTVSLDSEQKHLSVNSTEIPPVSDSSSQYRQVPFSHSRYAGDTAFSGHTPFTAQMARNHHLQSRPNSFYTHSPSARDSRTSTLASPAAVNVPAPDGSDLHSPYAGHAFPFPPGQDRTSFITADPRPSSARQQSISPAPQVAEDRREAQKQQSQSLLRNKEREQEKDNWYVFEDTSDLGSAQHGNSLHSDDRTRTMTMPVSEAEQAPPVPEKNINRNSEYLGPTEDANKENFGGVKRQLTVSSSVYSGDEESVMPAGTPRVRYYGDLAERQAARESQIGEGVRTTSSGVELEERAPLWSRRMVSGKGAEEGRGGWRRGRSDI